MRPFLWHGTRIDDFDRPGRGLRSAMKIGALAAGLVLAFSVSGCRVSPPAKLETATMTRIKHSLTVRGKNIHNPLPDSSRTIESGKSAFSNYCVACHGLDGQNTGVPF